MSGRGGPGGVGRRKGEVVYEGRYAVVVDEGLYGLRAHPREDPTGREKEYLLLMIEELLEASDEAFGHTDRVEIIIRAAVKYDNGRFALAVRRDGDVWVDSLVLDYMDFIKNADALSADVVDRDFGYHLEMYRGRYIVAVKDRNNILHAFGRKDVRMRSGLLAKAVIKEVVTKFDPLTKLMGAKAVLLRVRVWRNNFPFYPLMVTKVDVEFVPADDDYTYLVEMADEVEFILPR